MTVLPELDEIERLATAAGADRRVDVQTVASIDCGMQRLPLHVFAFGNPSPDAAAFGVFGGVHGLERIGAEVATTFVRSLLQRLRWDAALERLLEDVRI